MKIVWSYDSQKPLVTLTDVSSDGESIIQYWDVYFNGKKIRIKSTTDDKGDTKIYGKDMEIGGSTAQQIIAFILSGSHPKYYPKPGKTVRIDSSFMEALSNN